MSYSTASHPNTKTRESLTKAQVIRSYITSGGSREVERLVIVKIFTNFYDPGEFHFILVQSGHLVASADTQWELEHYVEQEYLPAPANDHHHVTP